MKLVKILCVAVLTISMMACKPSTEKKETVAVESNMPAKLVTSNVSIEGMTCEIGCAKTIESKIGKLEGVSTSKVDFEAKKGTFTYDSNKTSEEKIINEINGLLDGKTYKASHAKACCKGGSEKAGCAKKEPKECAEKCGHKEGESCSKKCATKCEKSEKESCSKECAEKCEHKEGEACSKASGATCESAKKEACKGGSEKACCASEKK